MTTILVSSAAIIFYLYILHIHMNGRMLDVYDRVHGDEGAFFIPEDREISLTTLRFIVAKSKLKRTHGTQRKFLVYQPLLSFTLLTCTWHISLAATIYFW
jgi:hypothetical protein